MNCTTCNVDTQASLFCHVCDSYLPKEKIGIKAKIWQRALALVLDGLFLFALMFATITLLAEVSYLHNPKNPQNELMGIVLAFPIAIFAYALASMVFLARGRTFGKWLVGIRVVNKSNGKLPGILTMFIRENFGRLISGFFFGLGYFWAIWDKDAQTWHDKIVGTTVLNQKGCVIKYPLSAGDKAVIAGSATILALAVIFSVFSGSIPKPTPKPYTVNASENFDPSIPRLATAPANKKKPIAQQSTPRQ